MKRTLSLPRLLLVLGLLLLLTIPALADSPSVVASSQYLRINGQLVGAEAYNINGSNYFKLRDIAMLLRDSDAQFEVGYASGTITLTTGQNYTPIGGELSNSWTDPSNSCVPSSQALLVDGKPVQMDAYNIGGYNYFKLRDLADALGFGVEYVAANRTIYLNVGTRTLYLLGSEAIDDRDPSGAGSVYTTDYAYDESGNLRKTTSATEEYDENGVLVYSSTNTTEYDENGNSIRYYYSTEEFDYTVINTFDAQGHLLTSESSDSDGYRTRQTYTYDAWGNQLTSVSTNSEGTGYSTASTYDARGNLLTLHFSSNQGYSYDTVTTYDAQGNWLTQSYSDSDGYSSSSERTNVDNRSGYTWIETYASSDGFSYVFRERYDAQGNLLSSSETDSDGYTYGTEYTYDARGNLIQSVYSDSSGNSSRDVYQYNSQGVLLSETYAYSSADDPYYSYSYTNTFDAQGKPLTFVYRDGEGESTQAWEYDAMGRLTAETYTDQWGWTEYYTYNYDEQGNLLSVIPIEFGSSRVYEYVTLIVEP